MPDVEQHLHDLREGLASPGRDVAAVVGAGVSIAISGNPLVDGEHVASWIGLLRHGITYCTRFDDYDDGWAERLRARLEHASVEELLGIADEITDALRAQGTGGQFNRWLRQTAAKLEVKEPHVGVALKHLGCPLLTTNYDSLLSRTTDRDPVTWRNPPLVQAVLRGDAQNIVHLHGYFDDVDSIVFGSQSYDAVLEDQRAQTMQQVFAAARTLVFVGCGATMGDPNFSRLRQWMKTALHQTMYPHYWLVADSEADAATSQVRGEDIFVIPYGAREDLPDFLARLGAKGSARHAIPGAPPDPQPDLAAVQSDDNHVEAKEQRPPLHRFSTWALALAGVALVIALVWSSISGGDGGGGTDTEPTAPSTTARRGAADIRVRPYGTSVELTWRDPSNGQAAYIVFYKSPTAAVWHRHLVDSGKTSFTVTGLDEAAPYCFYVSARYRNSQINEPAEVRGCAPDPNPDLDARPPTAAP